MRVLVLDTDVLIALSCAKGQFTNLLAELFQDRLIVPATVARGLRVVVGRKSGLACAGYVLGQPWVGEGLEEDEDDLLEVSAIRERIARPGDLESMHMGEASVLHFVQRDPTRIAVFSDRGARDYASTNGVPCLTTAELFSIFV